MGKKNRESSGSHVNIYASPSSRRGNQEKEKSRREPYQHGKNPNPEVPLGKPYDDSWSIPQTIIEDGVLYERSKSIPVRGFVTHHVPAGWVYDGNFRRVWKEAHEERVECPVRYRGIYQKVREIGMLEEVQKKLEVERLKERERRKNRPLVERLKAGLPLREQREEF
ncbi:MAG: hypothetical protein ACP5NS_02445 [Candidatus Pacearchaeota archaeon]